MQELFKKIFNKEIDNPDIPRFLDGVTRQYPYFTAAHFYLLSKTAVSDASFSSVAAKTALHFGNPFLLNYRLEKMKKVKVEEVTSDELRVEEDERVEALRVDELKGNELRVEEVVALKAEKVEMVKEFNPVDETPQKEEMLFEPLFATDYFASQGIKLSEEVQPADKLGKQLKSFTDWLKSMKKIHDQKLPPGSEQIDLAVQTLAEKSNLEENIITESMAEAYLQQNKPKKAIEILEKLSLLDPAKNAYFAAKIEQLRAK